MKPIEKTIKAFPFIILFFAIISCKHQSKEIHLTYIANAGFHINSTQTSILIDALHTHGPDTYLKPSPGLLDSIINGHSIFKTIDYLLITHKHPDHFNDSITFEFLNKHEETQLICPQQVTEILQKQRTTYQKYASRITTIALDTGRTKKLSINGLNISATHIKHADDYKIDNLLYIIDLNSVKVMHSGDSFDTHAINLKDIDLQREKIDLAILTTGYGRNNFSIAKEQIAPKEIVFCHFHKHLSKRLKNAIKTDTTTFDNITVFFNRLESKKYSF